MSTLGTIEAQGLVPRVRHMIGTQSRPYTAAPAEDAVDGSIVFAEGLVGCGHWRRFVLLSDDTGELPFGILKCLDEPGVALTVTDPEFVQPGYSAPLTLEQKLALRLEPGIEPTLYCTLTIAEDGAITANLLGPLVINPELRQGIQLVLADSTYSARHPIGRLGADACSS